MPSNGVTICATEIEEIKKSDIIDGIKNRSVVFVDDLRQEHLDDVLTMVRESKLFDKKEKELYFYE